MYAKLAALLFLLGSVSADPALLERARHSWLAGTGGDAAFEALCNTQAVIEFYDGHHTPELISDELLMWHLGYMEAALPPPGMSERGEAMLRDGLSKLRQMRTSLFARSKERGRAIGNVRSNEEANRIRSEGNEDDKRTKALALQFAADLLVRLRRDLPKEDSAMFSRWFEEKRRDSVILLMDQSKMIRFNEWECKEFLPTRAK